MAWHGMANKTDDQSNLDIDKIRAEQAEMARNNPELWKQINASAALKK